MKVGKISENVLKRSVIRQLHTKRDEVVMGASVGEDCAALKLDEDEIIVLSTDPITGTVYDIGKLAIVITTNDLSSSGAEPIGVMLTILLPEDFAETELKTLMQQLETACSEVNVQIIGGHTEVTRAVNQPVVTVCGVGKAKQGQLVSTAGARPGMDIIATKWIALEGTSIIAKEKEAELKSRYSDALIQTAKDFDRCLSVMHEAAAAVKSGAGAMHDVTEGGIFGALWEMAEASGVGLEIDLKKIPIRQETVEVCEYFDVNPYELISSGCMLIAADDGNSLVREIEKTGIKATIIGKAIKGNDRIIYNGNEERYLEPPKTDELYKVIK